MPFTPNPYSFLGGLTAYLMDFENPRCADRRLAGDGDRVSRRKMI